MPTELLWCPECGSAAKDKGSYIRCTRCTWSTNDDLEKYGEASYRPPSTTDLLGLILEELRYKHWGPPPTEKAVDDYRDARRADR